MLVALRNNISYRPGSGRKAGASGVAQTAISSWRGFDPRSGPQGPDSSAAEQMTPSTFPSRRYVISGGEAQRVLRVQVCGLLARRLAASDGGARSANVLRSISSMVATGCGSIVFQTIPSGIAAPTIPCRRDHFSVAQRNKNF